MDKRLAKRHKRQVSRAREKVRVSEPDVRTPEQIAAAREASRSAKRDVNPWPTLPTDSGEHAGSPAAEPEKTGDAE